MQESLAQQEAMLTQGFERVAAELRRHAASVMPHPAADVGASIWTSPEVLGRLDALRTLLLQADGCATWTWQPGPAACPGASRVVQVPSAMHEADGRGVTHSAAVQ